MCMATLRFSLYELTYIKLHITFILLIEAKLGSSMAHSDILFIKFESITLIRTTNKYNHTQN